MTLKGFGPLPPQRTKRRRRSAQFRICALRSQFISNNKIARLRECGWMDDRWAIVGLPSHQHAVRRFCGPCTFSAERAWLVNNKGMWGKRGKWGTTTKTQPRKPPSNPNPIRDLPDSACGPARQGSLGRPHHKDRTRHHVALPGPNPRNRRLMQFSGFLEAFLFRPPGPPPGPDQATS